MQFWILYHNPPKTQFQPKVDLGSFENELFKNLCICCFNRCCNISINKLYINKQIRQQFNKHNPITIPIKWIIYLYYVLSHINLNFIATLQFCQNLRMSNCSNLAFFPTENNFKVSKSLVSNCLLNF